MEPSGGLEWWRFASLSPLNHRILHESILVNNHEGSIPFTRSNLINQGF